MHMMNEDSEYCLRWHRHLTNFMEKFEDLLENEELADVFFFAEGKLIKAHKLVLSTCSPYFQNLFKQTLDRHPIIVLKDVKIDHIRALLEFMYRGTVNVPQDALGPIMKMAETLNIKGLADGVADVEKVEEENADNDNAPMSLIHPKVANQYTPPPPPPPPPNETHLNRHLSNIYNTPSTSVHSVLSTALTMPSALGLTSPLSLPHLASLPPNLASSLASTLSNAIPQSIASFIPPREMPLRDDRDSPLSKRRRKHRRSGETIDSGDSDGRSSGSPGDSVSNLHLPRIPATITPIGLHRQHLQHYHLNSSLPHLNSSLPHLNSSLPQQQQPRDLSIHSSQNHNSNNHDRPPHNSFHRDRVPTIKPPPALLPHHSIENRTKPQDEPENLEHRPSLSIKTDHDKIASNSEETTNRRSESPHDEKSSTLTSGRQSDERSVPPRPSPKCSSDPESLVSPAKRSLSQNRLDETSSDNHFSEEEERDENSNGHRESVHERLSDSTPGPSTSRPHSEEAPHTQSFLGWPYSSEPNSADESFPNFPGEPSPGFWKNSFKGGLLAPYLGSSLGQLPHTPRGLSSTFPGLYGTPGGTPPGWGRSESPPILGLPAHLRSNECSRCGRLYKTRKGLKHHIKNECGVEPRFQCTHCDWKFKQKAHLLRHMARKHTIS